METVNCDLCGATSHSPLFDSSDYVTKEEFKLVRCTNCGLVFVNPQPLKSALSPYYPEAYYGDEPFLYEKVDARRRYTYLTKSFKGIKGKALDIGCGRGLFLKRLQGDGWETLGTELSEGAAKYARDVLGVNVMTLEVEKCGFDEGSFDLITMFHSLEHLKSPLSTLHTVSRILKSSGTFIVEVPRFNSFYSRIFAGRWFHLDVPRHLFHFEDQTIDELLREAGLALTDMRKYEVMADAFGALQSILNVTCARMNLLNDINTGRTSLKGILKSGETRLKADALLSLTLQTVLFPFLLLAGGVLSIFNVGGTLIVSATKKRSFI